MCVMLSLHFHDDKMNRHVLIILKNDTLQNENLIIS
jgi:hypothetical protein